MANVSDMQNVPVLIAGPSPYWINPFNRVVVHRWDANEGPQLAAAGYANGGVPVVLVPGTVAQFGQSGGGISIF